ncbi:MAG: HEPN domain-containing protein [Allorhizobium sp.]
MATVVDSIYLDFQDAARVLGNTGEISLKLLIESHLRRTLLLSAASYFELRITRDVEGFCSELTEGNELIVSLIKTKVISRQYHSWFSWDSNNANTFFAMFGPSFKQYMSGVVSKDEDLKNAIKAFLELGNERNKLVHSDYASYLINKTPDEIHALYLLGLQFVERIGVELRAYSKKMDQIEAV